MNKIKTFHIGFYCVACCSSSWGGQLDGSMQVPFLDVVRAKPVLQ